MLFSALVDADFLETERWFAQATGNPIERGWSRRLSDLKNVFDSHIAQNFEARIKTVTSSSAGVVVMVVPHTGARNTDQGSGAYITRVAQAGRGLKRPAAVTGVHDSRSLRRGVSA